ncbi:NAD-dependent epimerase/dehydratase family protein [Cryobacterium arcticum]|uniref:UDP-glucose 4-epimerase n=1 Tax=Cryobacterium arcticum TaxID=670052 RepID=A0A1B1BPJ5_9MICO|nr:NAD-dependent epimerase/dehydratase family protein [Cryobacterium arcticum]ANP74431.1 mRNA-binding protein [Cryobacterium arcticum]
MSATLSVLFIGGSGVISAAAAELAVARGHRLTVLNRGQSDLQAVPAAAELLTADVRDAAAVRAALGERHFDVVVDFVAFTPEHVRADIEQFTDRCGQYVFISSASAYQKPPAALPIRESTPLHNPHWQYSRDKIACENVLLDAYRDQGFPVTIIRPSHTYDRTQITLLNGWTDIHRMRTGQPVVVHGDGTSLWTLTHSTDFAKALVGLFGRSQALGDSFTITSDEYLPWDALYAEYARAAGAPAPEIVHVASDTMAAENPEWSGPLLGDRSHSVIFDNTKVKALVPDFVCTTPVALGFREAIAWYDAHPEQQVVDAALNATLDRLVSAHSTRS